MVSTNLKATLINKENSILKQFREELTIRNFIVKNNCLYVLKKGEDGEVFSEYVCRLIWLNRIIVDKGTNQVELELIYHYLQQYRKITIPRSMFADKNFKR